MPTSTQYDVVKAQCDSFEQLGWIVKFEIQSNENYAAPKIIISKPSKFIFYKFCDPDWCVVSRQLAQLYKNLKDKKC